jgi:hypothetical protein
MSSGSPAVTLGSASPIADQISSVTNGMSGCSRRSTVARPSAAATHVPARSAEASARRRSTLAISRNQSQ